MIALIILSAIALLVIFMPVKIIAEVENKKVYLKLILYGVIKINLKAKTKHVKHELKDTKDVMEERIRKAPQIRVWLKIAKKSRTAFLRLMKYVSINIHLNIEYGFSQPDKTAIAFGLMNYILFSLESIFRYILKGYSGVYSIKPDFKNQKFDFDSKISISMIFNHVLVFIFKTFFIYMKYRPELHVKGGENNARTSNRRINEDYNG